VTSHDTTLGSAAHQAESSSRISSGPRQQTCSDAGPRVSTSRTCATRLLLSHSGLVVSERLKASLGPGFIESSRIFDRVRSQRGPGTAGELGAIELRLPGIDPDPVSR
jgi:hypothetical protein